MINTGKTDTYVSRGSSEAVVERSGKSTLTSSLAAAGSDLEKQELIGHSTEKMGEEDWWKNKPLLMSLVVTAWMLSIAKYNDELGPIFVSAPVSQVCLASSPSLKSFVTAIFRLSTCRDNAVLQAIL